MLRSILWLRLGQVLFLLVHFIPFLYHDRNIILNSVNIPQGWLLPESPKVACPKHIYHPFFWTQFVEKLLQVTEKILISAIKFSLYFIIFWHKDCSIYIPISRSLQLSTYAGQTVNNEWTFLFKWALLSVVCLQNYINSLLLY